MKGIVMRQFTRLYLWEIIKIIVVTFTEKYLLLLRFKHMKYCMFSRKTVGVVQSDKRKNTCSNILAIKAEKFMNSFVEFGILIDSIQYIP